LTFTFVPESSTASIDWRFGENVTSLTFPFFVSSISCEYVRSFPLSRRGIRVWLARYTSSTITTSGNSALRKKRFTCFGG
jgi:hypothetical protein